MMIRKEQAERRKLTDMLAQVSQETGIDAADIIGKKRRALFVEARSFFARLARAEGYRLVDIGEALGGRSHTVVNLYLSDRSKPKEDAPVTKEELRKEVSKLTVEEKKALVSELAGSGTKEERDTLAEIFSGLKGASVAGVEAGGAVRPPDPALSAAAKKKSFLDDL